VIGERLAYRVAEAAAATGLGERTIWRAVATGSLPVVKHGRATLILAASLEAWLRAQEETPAGDALVRRHAGEGLESAALVTASPRQDSAPGAGDGRYG